MSTVAKPKLPKEWYQATAAGSAAFIGYAVLVATLGLAGTYASYVSALPWALKLVALPACWLVTAQGLHLLGWVGHEGFHFNLARNKLTCAFLAILCTGPIALFSTVGENSIHWSHHRFTNGEGDPQVDLFPKYKRLWSRLLLARVELEHIYLRNLLRLAFGRLEVSAAFPRRTMEWLARLDLLSSALWLAFYVWVFVHAPALGAVLVLAPHLLLFVTSSVRPYVEHAGTEASAYQQARTYKSPLLTALYFFNNYHLEHHLYPSVPCWRLPRVHALLRGQGVYAKERPHVTNGFWEAQKRATALYAYPEPACSPSREARRTPSPTVPPTVSEISSVPKS